LHPITILGVVLKQPVKHYQAMFSRDEMTETLGSCFGKPGDKPCYLPKLTHAHTGMKNGVFHGDQVHEQILALPTSFLLLNF
jgi:hypothetical protein